MSQANGVPPAIDRELLVADVSWRDDPAVQAWSRPGAAARRPRPAGTPSAVEGMRAEDVAVVLVDGRPLVVPIPRAVALASGYILLDPDPQLLRDSGVLLDVPPDASVSTATSVDDEPVEAAAEPVPEVEPESEPEVAEPESVEPVSVEPESEPEVAEPESVEPESAVVELDPEPDRVEAETPAPEALVDDMTSIPFFEELDQPDTFFDDTRSDDPATAAPTPEVPGAPEPGADDLPVAPVFELLDGPDDADHPITAPPPIDEQPADLEPSLWGEEPDDTDGSAELEPSAEREQPEQLKDLGPRAADTTAEASADTTDLEQLTDAGAIWWPEVEDEEQPSATVDEVAAPDDELRIWAAAAVPPVQDDAATDATAPRWPESDLVPTWPEEQIPADAGVVWPPAPASPGAAPPAPTGLIAKEPAPITAADPVVPPKASLQVPIWAEILGVEGPGDTAATGTTGNAIPVHTSNAVPVFPFIDTDVAVPMSGPAPVESDASAPAVRNAVEEWSVDLGTPNLPDRSGDAAFDWPEPESSWPSTMPQWDELYEPSPPSAALIGRTDAPELVGDDEIDWPVYEERHDDASPPASPDEADEGPTSPALEAFPDSADETAPADEALELTPTPVETGQAEVPDEGRAVPVRSEVHEHLLHAGRISVRGVVRVLRSPVGTIRVLDNVDLDVAGGELVAISGPSPSGASTLLDCLAGLDEIDAGEITMEGVSIGAATDAERAHQRSGFTGYVPQENDLIELFTVLENVALPLLSAGWAGKEARGEALSRLEALGLADQHAFLPSQLSAAQRRCVLVARALAGEPSVVLADHPLAYLDDHQAAAVIDGLLAVRSRGGSVIVVDRDARIVSHADRRLALRLGRLTLESTS